MTSELELRMSGWSDEEKQEVYDKVSRLERIKSGKLAVVDDNVKPKEESIKN